MAKIALISGITGQDGSYLAEFLLKKKYKVHGLVRRVALEDRTHRLWRLKGILKKINLHAASLESYASIVKIIQRIKPKEIYHLGAQSYVDYAFQDEFSTLNTNINGTHYFLSAVKDFSPKTKFYFAGSSEMFGKVKTIPQNEKTMFHPRSAYGISKVTGHDLTRNYREAYNLFCCTGIATIKLGLQRKIVLGNLDAKRDWGHAKDYVEAMWLMLQKKNPDDFVIATGKQHSVREFAKLAFSMVGLNYKDYIVTDKNLFRPAEVHTLLGNYSKAKKLLKWKPKTSFKNLVKDMVESDIEFVKKSGY
jgi:GDPmannose 4,6-dehydratase